MNQRSESDPWAEVEGLPEIVKIHRHRRDDPALQGLEPWRITLLELQGLGGWLAEQPLGLYQVIGAYDDDILSMVAQQPDGSEPWFRVCKHLSQSTGECLAVGRLFDRLAMKLSHEISDALRRASVSDLDK